MPTESSPLRSICKVIGLLLKGLLVILVLGYLAWTLEGRRQLNQAWQLLIEAQSKKGVDNKLPFEKGLDMPLSHIDIYEPLFDLMLRDLQLHEPPDSIYSKRLAALIHFTTAYKNDQNGVSYTLQRGQHHRLITEIQRRAGANANTSEARNLLPLFNQLEESTPPTNLLKALRGEYAHSGLSMYSDYRKSPFDLPEYMNAEEFPPYLTGAYALIQLDRDEAIFHRYWARHYASVKTILDEREIQYPIKPDPEYTELATARSLVAFSTVPSADIYLDGYLSLRANLHITRTGLHLLAGTTPPLLTDPFDGQPIRIKKTGSGWIVYSIGKNGVDDGGSTEAPKYSPLDICWEIVRSTPSP